MRQGSQNLGHNVGRGHEIDIMTALFLKVYHHCSELLVSHFDPVPLVADPVILTEETEKIAVRKKNCSRTLPADQRAFLAKVRIIA